MRLLWVLDCADPDALADFWAAALRFDRRPYTPPYARVYDPSGRWPDLLLQRVPEAKAAKNRVHLDLQVLDAAPEVARLVALGARVLSPPRRRGLLDGDPRRPRGQRVLCDRAAGGQP